MPTTPYFFDDIELGGVVVTAPLAVSEAAMIDFARDWDPMPIHVDPAAAAASMFGAITASSVYTFGLKQLLVKQFLNEDAVICMLGFDAGRLPAPLYGDRMVRLEATWLDKRMSNSRPDRGIVRFRVRMLTDRDELVLEFEETILIRRRAPS